MTAKTQLKVKLYGGMRQYAPSAEVLVDVELPQSCQAVKQLLKEQLAEGADELLEHCVLATTDEILPAEGLVVREQELSVLPPVCGG